MRIKLNLNLHVELEKYRVIKNLKNLCLEKKQIKKLRYKKLYTFEKNKK